MISEMIDLMANKPTPIVVALLVPNGIQAVVRAEADNCVTRFQ
jgi:hypothetical protein